MAYLVPNLEYKDLFLSGIDKLVKLGAIDLERAWWIRGRVFTYEEFIAAVKQGKIEPDFDFNRSDAHPLDPRRAALLILKEEFDSWKAQQGILPRGSSSGSSGTPSATPQSGTPSPVPTGGRGAASTAIASAVSYVSSLEYSYDEPITAADDYEIQAASDDDDQIYAEWDEESEEVWDLDDQEAAADDFAVTGAPITGAAELFEIPIGI